jgi:hypothetical protein
MVRSVRPWSLARLADTGFLSNFDLSPDGHLVALIPAERYEDRQSENHVTFMLNFPRSQPPGWSSGKRRAPAPAVISASDFSLR